MVAPKWSHRKDVIPPEHASFGRGHSTLDQVAQITDDIKESFDMRQVTGAVFLNLTTTYDTVRPTSLHLKTIKRTNRT